jgi:hypothetical protein
MATTNNTATQKPEHDKNNSNHNNNNNKCSNNQHGMRRDQPLVEMEKRVCNFCVKAYPEPR